MEFFMPWDGGVGLGCRLGVCWAVNHSKTIKMMQNANPGVTEVRKSVRKVLYVGQKLK